ncbi:MAG: OmpA family protein [Sphingobacteriaceae bacterium]|nr:MAG: OmpA family protein [Sphingobacteriaceae bacterium]
MKRYILPLAAVLLFSANASHAQFLNKLKKKAEAAVNKAIDEGEAPKVKKPKAEQPVPQAGNTAQAEQPATDAPQATPLQSYTKYDFIPGQNLIYTDNFMGEAAGELPASWNSNGNGAVTKLNNFEGNWMRLAQNATYLPGKELKSTDNFTLEFDVIFDFKSNGYGFPEFTVGMLATGKKAVGANDFLSERIGTRTFDMQLSNGTERTNIRVSSYQVHTSYFRSPVKTNDDLPKNFGKVNHIALQAQKERLRIWINGEKILDAPKGIPAGDPLNQLFFYVSSSNYKEDQLGIFISNIKVAQGAPDLRNKLVNEGRFSTSGILFDVNAATIKPESNGILAEIAAVLKDNPTININIIGHTDADGNAAANQKLSLARSESVKNTFVTTYSIDASRLQVAGKGAAQPVAPNTTQTGKAQNRRVEFLKL